VFIYNKIADDIHPGRPSEYWVTDDRWLFMNRCWSDYASGDRPTATEVLDYIKMEIVKVQDEEYSALREKEKLELLDLTGHLQRNSEFPSAGGGFADIWQATWQRDSLPCKVAVKVLRHHIIDERDGNKLNKRLRRELQVWRKLGEHPNVLPLYGTTSDFGFYTSFVCPWLDNGHLSLYLDRKGTTLSLGDRFKILCNVAAGLSHLHSFPDPVIHGDLTGSNVLIDMNGVACLCDFGLSTMLAGFHGTSFFTSTISGSVRWAAPELYQVKDGVVAKGPSTESDIYSFGCVMLQTLSGAVPYCHLQDLQVLFQLVHSRHPERPQIVEVTDEYWRFMVRCWAEHGMRPKIEEVRQYILNFWLLASQSRQHTLT